MSEPTSRRTIAVIGPGRVGTALALSLSRAGERVVAVVDSGSGSSAAALAERIAGCRAVADVLDAVTAADTVLLTVPDDQVEAVVADVARRDGWRADHRVLHCSGALGAEALRLAALSGAGTAACHPAQTIPSDADADTLVGVLWAVTCAPASRGWAEELVTATGGDAFPLDEDARVLYHAALTVAANAVGAAVSVARQLLLGARVADPARVLSPLIEASISNVLRDGASALTGPVVRGDVGTVQRHLAALDVDVPHLAQAYRTLQSVVLDQSARGREDYDNAALAELLQVGRKDAPWSG